MNTQSNKEEDGLKMPPAEHTHSTQAGVRKLWDILYLLLYLQWAAQA